MNASGPHVTHFNPSRLFILRPVATSLLMIALLIVGILAYRLLPVSALPQVDYPTIQIVTLYPGASPDVMTSVITAPLERQLGQMPGLTQMSSTSSGGASVITLQFNYYPFSQGLRELFFHFVQLFHFLHNLIDETIIFRFTGSFQLN